MLVNGAGPIGLLAAGAAIEAGAAEVWVSDLLDRPLRLAERMDADGQLEQGRVALCDPVIRWRQ